VRRVGRLRVIRGASNAKKCGIQFQGPLVREGMERAAIKEAAE